MYSVYQVMAGEDLEDVALQVGVSAEELMMINGLTSGVIPGEYVVIPNKMGENMYFRKYTIQKGDTIYSIAREYGISSKNLLRLNGLNENDTIYPGDMILVPKDGTIFYITGMDDTLNDVSSKMGITPNDMGRSNPTIYLTNDQLIVYKK